MPLLIEPVTLLEKDPSTGELRNYHQLDREGEVRAFLLPSLLPTVLVPTAYWTAEMRALPAAYPHPCPSAVAPVDRARLPYPPTCLPAWLAACVPAASSGPRI